MISLQYFTNENIAGGLFVIGAVFLNWYFMGPAVTGLNIGLMFAYGVWLANFPDLQVSPGKVGSIYLLAVAVQCAHLAEEYAMDFHLEFPGLFGYTWPGKLFIAFNLIWLLVFLLAAWGVFRRIWLAYLVVWFFVIAGSIGNGILHIILSLIAGGYFPGLITGLAHLAIGLFLLIELIHARKQTKASHLSDRHR